jgi:hypothetical protein
MRWRPFVYLRYREPVLVFIRSVWTSEQQGEDATQSLFLPILRRFRRDRQRVATARH